MPSRVFAEFTASRLCTGFMNSKDAKKLKILEVIHLEEGAPSQRELARTLNVSVGFINAFVKHLVKKGYIKVTAISKNRVKYLLTPKGIVEKTRLTYKHIQNSYIFYRAACNRLDKLYANLEKTGAERIAFYGMSGIADLAYHVLKNSDLKFSGMIDDDHAGEIFGGYEISPVSKMDQLKFDRLLITDFIKMVENKNKLNSQCDDTLWVYL